MEHEAVGEWEPLAPKLVVEVQYDHFTSGRFRHGTKFLRWRPDKAPRQCTIEQVEQASASAGRLLAGRRERQAPKPAREASDIRTAGSARLPNVLARAAYFIGRVERGHVAASTRRDIRTSES